jgi:hypothetical protein
VTLGNQYYADYLALKNRALQGMERVLSAWGYEEHDVMAALAVMATRTLTAASRGAISERAGGSDGPSIARLREELGTPSARELIEISKFHPAPRLRDRVQLWLLRGAHFRLLIGLARLMRRASSVTR